MPPNTYPHPRHADSIGRWEDKDARRKLEARPAWAKEKGVMPPWTKTQKYTLASKTKDVSEAVGQSSKRWARNAHQQRELGNEQAVASDSLPEDATTAYDSHDTQSTRASPQKSRRQSVLPRYPPLQSPYSDDFAWSSNEQYFDVVEIGLGTNGTFLHYLSDESCGFSCDLFQFIIPRRKASYRYLGVDMVDWVVDDIKERFKLSKRMALANVAISNENRCSVSFYGISKEDREKHANDRQIQWYLSNMTSREKYNPFVDRCYDHLVKEHWVRQVCYGTLCKEYHVYAAQILKIDAEGDEALIIEGVIKSCLQKTTEFPYIIQIETNGLGDAKYGPGTEENTIRSLEQHGYRVGHGSFYHDTVLLYGKPGTHSRLDEFEKKVLRFGCNCCWDKKSMLNEREQRGYRGAGRSQWSLNSKWYCAHCWEMWHNPREKRDTEATEKEAQPRQHCRT
eukprot:GEMP01025572.1.p1 GENE.GEMP01025572.1~~GEMP01025572.1.p1  ORF type:complete len:452 (+),score=78.20 GEMP01025572.1:434-1789(+)